MEREGARGEGGWKVNRETEGGERKSRKSGRRGEGGLRGDEDERREEERRGYMVTEWREQIAEVSGGYPYFESLDRAEGLLEFITVICPS